VVADPLPERWISLNSPTHEGIIQGFYWHLR